MSFFVFFFFSFFLDLYSRGFPKHCSANQPHCNQRETCEVLEKYFLLAGSFHYKDSVPTFLFQTSTYAQKHLTVCNIKVWACLFPPLSVQYSFCFPIWCYSICKSRLQNVIALEAKHALNMQNNINLLELFCHKGQRWTRLIDCFFASCWVSVYFFLTSIAAL